MKLIELKKPNRVIDTKDLETKLEQVKRLRDERIVKPESFLYSKTYGTQAFYNFSESERKLLRKKMNIELTGKTEVDNDGIAYEDAIFYPIVPKARILFHTAPVFLDRSSLSPDSLLKNKVIGGVDLPIYLKCAGTIESETGKSDLLCKEDLSKKYWCDINYQIDRDELLKTRSIFYDPTAIKDDCKGSEWGRSYVVFGGVPCQAILGARFVKGKSYPLSIEEKAALLGNIEINANKFVKEKYASVRREIFQYKMKKKQEMEREIEREYGK